MAQATTISEEIFKRWFEKICNERTIPRILVEAIRTSHEQMKLPDAEALGKLLEQVGGSNDDKY